MPKHTSSPLCHCSMQPDKHTASLVESPELKRATAPRLREIKGTICITKTTSIVQENIALCFGPLKKEVFEERLFSQNLQIGVHVDSPSLHCAAFLFFLCYCITEDSSCPLGRLEEKGSCEVNTVLLLKGNYYLLYLSLIFIQTTRKARSSVLLSEWMLHALVKTYLVCTESLLALLAEVHG